MFLGSPDKVGAFTLVAKVLYHFLRVDGGGGAPGLAQTPPVKHPETEDRLPETEDRLKPHENATRIPRVEKRNLPPKGKGGHGASRLQNKRRARRTAGVTKCPYPLPMRALFLRGT
ncbi:hypothetical protein MRX96_029779 [Rhipicephalus microplus]